VDIILSVTLPIFQAMGHFIAQAQGNTGFTISDKGMKDIGAGIAMGLGAFGPALAIGNLAGRAMDALGRNPEAQPVIQTNIVSIMIGFVF
jgi:F0F1-type ATP synthase membrane subunit c/vacuolar-type H+-ATPase subunit K